MLAGAWIRGRAGRHSTHDHFQDGEVRAGKRTGRQQLVRLPNQREHASEAVGRNKLRWPPTIAARRDEFFAQFFAATC